MDKPAGTVAGTVAGPPGLAEYATQSPYSDPGAHSAAVAAVEPDPASLHRAACSAVVHYRAGSPTLTDEQQHDIDRRWLSAVLDAAAERQAGPLEMPRDLPRQVAGCCRDHTLLAVSVLRAHAIPARSRIGFAGYFEPAFHGDHVVVERWDADSGRWVRSDPELDPADFDFDVHDMPTGPGAPFETAAEVWRAIRSGDADPTTYGVSGTELIGKDLVRDYVMLELAHRQRDELLLWDLWGPRLIWAGGEVTARAVAAGVPGADMEPEAFDALADELAALLVAADAGDVGAVAELAARYRSDPRLRPGERVVTLSPSGRAGVTDLRDRTTAWER
ncbi:transglutaminase-like domain-containing protein [Georgenia alba]|uniref:Transglutaminase-like domain-containing protein n=1 Tax=Georgenia alba TaxID=2233858 RepID=A0ABW2Q5J5_9MICO